MSIRYDEYMNFIAENFNIKDDETRRGLLSFNEAEKDQLMQNLTSKLYDKIVSKVDEIDFGTIPLSKGNINKVQNIDSMRECIKIMHDIVQRNNESTAQVDIISEAMNNMAKLSAVFERAYALNIEFPIVIYNTIVLAIVSSTSLLISSCIEYIKTPNATFEISFSKTAYRKTKDYLMLNTLVSFNKSCASGEMEKALGSVIKDAKILMIKRESEMEESNSARVMQPVNEVIGTAAAVWGGVQAAKGAILLVGAVGTAILAIVKFSKDAVYYYYNTRTDLSDYFAVQATLLQMNAASLQYKTDLNNVDKIYRSQMRIADTFKNISNKLMIKNKRAEVATYDEEKKDKKLYNLGDVGMSSPVASALF